MANMAKTTRRDAAFWILQGPGWLVLSLLIYAQGVSAFSYGLGIAMGTQWSAERITEVGTAFSYGFAFGDLSVYIPLLLIGLIGHLRGADWGRVCFAAALGISVYGPIVWLATVVDARGAQGWELASETQYWWMCLLTAAWGALGLCLLMRKPRIINREKI